MVNNGLTINQGSLENARILKQFLAAGTYCAGLSNHAVARLELELKEHLSNKNPFIKHADIQLFVVLRDGQAVGRISAHIDHKNQKPHSGHFGFCAAEDKDIFDALMDSAEKWLKDRNCIHIGGPYSFSMNDEVGLLIDGFEHAPRLLMNYAQPWMASTLEERGYAKAKDLLAYDMSTAHDLPVQAAKMAQRAETSSRVHARPFNMKKMKQDLKIIQTIFNNGWANNWGFIPMSEDDLDYMAHSMKPILVPEFAHIAYVDDKPAAMIVALPNINEAIHDMQGRLMPFNWIKLLWRLKGKGLKTARVLLMGVEPEHQGTIFGSALSLMLIARVHRALRDKKMETVELSWILEDNEAIRNMIESVGGTISRRYRLFEKPI